MSVVLSLVEVTCSLTGNNGSVALQWNGASPMTWEVKLKQSGVAIYSFTGTLISSYSFPSVAAGTYDCQVFNASLGASNIITRTVSCLPTTLYSNYVRVNPSTIGGSDGTINLTPGGGYTPYAYLWGDGPTTQNRTGLAAGTYTVTVSSADGQTFPLSIVLTDPTACDLTITSIAVGKESFRRAGDATLTVTVDTGNVGTIEYSLDNVTWQTSNVFTGLDEGEYTVYTKQNACTDDATVSITRRDPLYWMQYDDLLGNVWKAELLEKNFSGTAERLNGSGNPVMIQQNGQGDERYEAVKGSECTLSFESATDFKFLNLFTADNRKYRVDVYTGPPAGPMNLFWTGYVLPELYSEPYTQPPYFVSIKAVDGLAMLKYVPFPLDGSEVFEWDIVKYIIDTLDLDLPIISSLDIYETTMVDAIDDEPLMQAKVNTAVYTKNNKKLKSLDVLKANLLIYYARIYQDRGTIRLTRYDQLPGIYGHRVYDKRGNFLSTRYVDPVIDVLTPPDVDEADPLAANGVIFCNSNASLEIKTAFREISVKQTYGLETNLITDGDFKPSAFSDPVTLINWTDTASIEQREAYPGAYSVAITDDGTTPGFKITSRPVYLYAGSTTEPNAIKVRFDYFVKASALGVTSVIIPYQIKIGTKYFDGSVWTSTPTIIEEDPAAVNGPRQVLYNSLTVPEDGEFTLTLYAAIPNDYTVEEVQYSNVFGQFLPGGAPVPESVTYQVTQSIPYTFVPDDLEVYHGDTPSPVFASAITIQATGSPTIVQAIEWKRRTVTEGKKLLQILAESIASDYFIPTQKITGDIRGKYYFGASLRHPFNENRIFVLNGATYATKSGIWSGEWLEALPTQPADTPPGELDDDTTVALDNGELSTPV